MVTTLGVLLGIQLDYPEGDDKMDVDPPSASPSKSSQRPATPPPDPDLNLSSVQKEVTIYLSMQSSGIFLCYIDSILYIFFVTSNYW